MLERVTIQHFRCLKHVEVGLRPLTVLIGPNDSGKSAFLAALRRLADADPTKGDPRAALPPSPEDHWRLNQGQVINIVGHVGDAQITYRPGQTGRYERNVPRKERLPLSVALFQLPALGVPMLSKGHSGAEPPILDEQASMTPALVDYILRHDRAGYSKFVEALRALIPGLEEIEVATPDVQTRRIELRIENGLRLPASNASNGVRLLIFFMALSYHPQPPNLILLEEPETGLHPRRLAEVMRLLHDITRGRNCGRPAQIVLTTHSPYLLDHVDLEQDQVLVMQRADDGSRTARAVDRDRLKDFLDDFMLGEVWYNEQEAGLLPKDAGG